MTSPLDRFADSAAANAGTGRAGLAQWQPALSGDIDIRIDRDGDWYHEGTRIERHALVQVFASILRREADGHYYLVTPVEKWRIRVEDAALLVVDVDRVWRDEKDVLECELNTGVRVVVDAVHSLSVKNISIEHAAADDEPRPYLQLDHGLNARLLRSVYYRLVAWGEADGKEWVIHSAGQRFVLGRID